MAPVEPGVTSQIWPLRSAADEPGCTQLATLTGVPLAKLLPSTLRQRLTYALARMTLPALLGGAAEEEAGGGAAEEVELGVGGPLARV